MYMCACVACACVACVCTFVACVCSDCVLVLHVCMRAYVRTFVSCVCVRVARVHICVACVHTFVACVHTFVACMYRPYMWPGMESLCLFSSPYTRVLLSLQQFNLPADVQHLFAAEVVLEHSRTKDHLGCDIGELLFVLLIAHDKMTKDRLLVEKEDGTSECVCTVRIGCVY